MPVIQSGNNNYYCQSLGKLGAHEVHMFQLNSSYYGMLNSKEHRTGKLQPLVFFPSTSSTGI